MVGGDDRSTLVGHVLVADDAQWSDPASQELIHYLLRQRTAVPLLVSSLFSGTVVDTLGRRRTAVMSDVMSALSVASPHSNRWSPNSHRSPGWATGARRLPERGSRHTATLASVAGPLLLTAGFLVWVYTLLLPAFARSGWLPLGLLEEGPFGIELLKPLALFGLAGLDQITHAMIWSMLANIGAYVGVSLSAPPGAEEHRQASLFVDVFRQGPETGGARFWRGTASVPALYNLLARFLGSTGADESFREYAAARGLRWPDDRLQPDAELVHHAEVQLAGAIGAASARVMVASVAKEEELSIEEVREILDEASQVVAYSHQLEQKSRELEAATTELRAANEQLKELDRLKDDFLSTVTHELRTPLTSIRAFTEILNQEPEIDAAQRQKFLGIITKETERLTRLINQVLDLAKLESGVAEWHMEPVDLREVVTATTAATAQLFREHDVSLDIDLPGTLPPVAADSDRLVQVMVNLLGNAVKFVAPGRKPRVEISAEMTGNTVRVAVADPASIFALTEAQRAMVLDMSGAWTLVTPEQVRSLHRLGLTTGRTTDFGYAARLLAPGLEVRKVLETPHVDS